MMCPPALRPAVVLLLAMLAAKGTSVLRSTYVIHRGYEDLAERLNQLGANIETFRDICRAVTTSVAALHLCGSRGSAAGGLAPRPPASGAPDLEGRRVSAASASEPRNP